MHANIMYLIFVTLSLPETI